MGIGTGADTPLDSMLATVDIGTDACSPLGSSRNNNQAGATVGADVGVNHYRCKPRH